ncbi:MAG: hypothetical protein J6W10_00690, partial [Kiritimatiellae bacterium]|nr:hypothetical protein [Kiritimatiellia bacterium]
PPDEMLRIFSDYRVIPTGLKHGTVTVLADGEPVEITTFRTDGEYLDSRRPESVSFTSRIEDDLSRRDFKVNAMAYNKKRGLVDLFDGKIELKLGIIRAVGDPEKRFSEDALRIMRAFRFSSQLGFDIDPETLAGAHATKNKLELIAKERIGSEMLRLLEGASPRDALEKMGDIIELVIPVSLDRSRFTAVGAGDEGDAIQRLAILLYGKNKDEILSVAHALKLSSHQTARLSKMSAEIPQNIIEGFDPIKARRLICMLGEDAEGALRVAAALDVVGEKELEILRAELSKDPCTTVGGLKINGSDLIKENIATGKAVGEMLARLLDAVIEDPTLNERESLLELAKGSKK